MIGTPIEKQQPHEFEEYCANLMTEPPAIEEDIEEMKECRSIEVRQSRAHKNNFSDF